MHATAKAEGREVCAEDLMSSPVVAVTTGHNLAAAWEAMRERRVHHLVVLEGHRLAGVLDDRTIAARWPAGGPEVVYSTRVGDLVSRGAWSVLPDEPASAVARVMTEAHCDAVPVVTAAGVLLGLVTATDLVAAVARGAVPVAADAESSGHDDRD
ncbi:MAG TPA: CBS domain-containing protein [Mycobacteriales bacterium]|jgi:CBS-domain-containing membrane protein